MAMDYFNPRVIDGMGMILDTTPGSPDTGSYVTEDQLKNWIKAGILFDGYYYNGNFYSDSGHTSPLAKVEGALYVDKTNANKALYVCLSSTYQSLTEEAQVQAIIDGLNDGTIVPLKAKQDQNGNVIDLTYETKADANDLKNALQATNARVTNLEQKAGDYTTVQYRGTNAVPSGKAKYGLVEKIVGKSRAWNQLVQSYTSGYATRVSDTEVSVSFSAGNSSMPKICYDIPTISGHKYLVYMKESANANVRTFNSGVVKFHYASEIVNGVAEIVTSDGTTSYFQIRDSDSSIGGNGTFSFLIRDLTIIFGSGNEPSTVAEAVALCPSILEYDDYGYSLVDTEVSGVRSVGRNIWNEIVEGGTINVSTGVNQSSSTISRSRDYIPIKPSTLYYASADYAGDIVALFYDYNKNFITGVGGSVNYIITGGGTFTTPNNAYYMRFFTGSAHLAGISFYESNASYNGQYFPYMTDTLSLPQPVILRSAGSVHEELDVESGEVTHPLRQVNLGSLTWTKSGDNSFYALLADCKSSPNNTKGNIVCGKYETETYAHIHSATTGIGVSNSNGVVILYDADFASKTGTELATALNGVYANYEIVTPDTSTNIGATTNCMIPTEGGGTINTIQTQTPVIDNSLDVGYLAL